MSDDNKKPHMTWNGQPLNAEFRGFAIVTDPDAPEPAHVTALKALEPTYVTMTWGMPETPKPPMQMTVTRVRHFVARYRRHGERRGVVRRRKWMIADVTFGE
jgi:hypothetical protein